MLQLYIEGYLQAMLDTFYRQEYLRVSVIENQVNFKELQKPSGQRLYYYGSRLDMKKNSHVYLLYC